MTVPEFSHELAVTGSSIPASLYPDHRQLLQCKATAAAAAQMYGPDGINAIAIYMTKVLEDLGVGGFLTKELGQLVLHGVYVSIAATYLPLMEEDPQLVAKVSVMPALLELAYRLLVDAANIHNGPFYDKVRTVMATLMDNPSIPLPLRNMLRDVAPVWEAFPGLQADFTDDDIYAVILQDTHEMLRELTDGYIVIYGTLPQASALKSPETPVLEASESLKDQASETVMVAVKTHPTMVKQLDDRMGLDVHDDLISLFTPQRARLANSEEQWTDTMTLTEPPLKELFQLWWRTKKHHLEGVRQEEARLMDCVRRFLQYLFTHDQLVQLTRCLPMEQVAENMLQFISGHLQHPPHMSAAQLRVSLAAAAVIAVCENETLMTECEAIWTKLGLTNEISLLHATIAAQGEGFLERITKVRPPKHELTLQ